MIKKTVHVPEALDEQLRKKTNQSKFIREAIVKALRKRKFNVELKCITQQGGYVSTSYVTVNALDFDGDLKQQIENHVDTLNALEERNKCVWIFDSLSEREVG